MLGVTAAGVVPGSGGVEHVSFLLWGAEENLHETVKQAEET